MNTAVFTRFEEQRMALIAKKGYPDIVVNGELVEDSGHLEFPADSHPPDDMNRFPGDIPAFKRNTPSGGFISSRNEIEKG